MAPASIDGYADGAGADRFDADGWLDTGDVGRLDDDGYLYLAGRDGDAINRGGEKIFPREIEEVLRRHPGVRRRGRRARRPTPCSARCRSRSSFRPAEGPDAAELRGRPDEPVRRRAGPGPPARRSCGWSTGLPLGATGKVSRPALRGRLLTRRAGPRPEAAR